MSFLSQVNIYLAYLLYHYIYERYEFCHPNFTCGYCCTSKWHWCDQSKSWASNIDSGKIISI